jgi:hypothetical protein
MKISIGNMLRVALFSLPLALPVFAQSATDKPPSGSEAQPMNQPAPSDTGQQNPSGSMDTNKEMNKEPGKEMKETDKGTTDTSKKKQHRDTTSPNY